jgi:hypothetical protein
MTWERALEADARLAARNALLIRAALRQQFDAERAFEGYARTMPDTNLSLPQQRLRARAWAIVNIRPNLEPLKEVLARIWAQGYALGDTAAREALLEAKEAQKAEAQGIVDWSKWKPGDAVAALLLKPPRAFQELFQSQGITFKGFSDTTLTEIGNALGEAIHLGLDAKQSAKLIANHVASPARALSIAITEQNRAISQATVNRYKDAGLQQHEWLVFDPCVTCAKNANIKENIGAPFPSGDTQPPAHPHCRCVLAPVIPGFDDPANTAGSIVTAPPIVESTENLIPVAESYSSLRNKEIEQEITEIKGYLPADIDDDRLLNAVAARGGQGEADNTDIYWPLRKKFKNMGLSDKDAKLQTQGTLLRIEYYLQNKEIKKDLEKTLRDWIDSNEIQAVESYRQNASVATRRVKDAMQSGKVTIAINKESLFRVLEEGKFKNQFESKRSGGLLDPELRKMREKATFDVDLQTPNEQRPVYGYITNNSLALHDWTPKLTAEQEWDNILNLWNPNTSQYGQIKVVLKDQVRYRTTVTIGDSLTRGSLAENINAKNPDLDNMGFQRQGAPEQNEGKPIASYFEAQVTGGVSIQDIDTIYAKEGPYQDIKNLVKNLGLDIKVVLTKG